MKLLEDDKSQVVTFAINGGAVRVSGKVRARVGGEVDKVVRLKRGKCRGRSKQSALRARESMACIDRSKIKSVFFGTIAAAPGPVTWENVHEHVRAWSQAMSARYSGEDWFVYWGLERHKKDGRPHIHFLIFFLGEVWSLAKLRQGQAGLTFRQWNDRYWANRLGVENVKIGCRVELLRDWGGVESYVTKYVAKVDESDAATGRRPWGWVRRSLIPIDLRQVVVPRSVGVRVVRELRKLREKRAGRLLYQFEHSDGSKGWARVSGHDLCKKHGFSEESAATLLGRAGAKVRRVRPKVLPRASFDPAWVDVVEDGRGGQRMPVEASPFQGFEGQLGFVWHEPFERRWVRKGRKYFGFGESGGLERLPGRPGRVAGMWCDVEQSLASLVFVQSHEVERLLRLYLFAGDDESTSENPASAIG